MAEVEDREKGHNHHHHHYISSSTTPMSNNFPRDLLKRLAVNHNHHHLPMAPKVEQPEAEEELELTEYVNQVRDEDIYNLNM
ncbi:ninja-family protein AFP3 [Sesbania bispinosa]|nr:ninja-family protein AFP3 [Sesbania bispinosa]